MRYSIAVISLIATACSSPERGGLADIQPILGQRISLEAAAPTTDALLTDADQAVQLALMYNPEMQAKYEQLSIAKADLVQAGLPANPSVDFALRFPGVVDVNVVENVLSLFLIPARRGAASSDLERVRHEVAHDLLRLVTDVRIAFYNYQAMLQKDKILGAIVESAALSADYSTRQRAAGNLSELDDTHHQLSYQRAELARAEHSIKIVEARETLGRLMGIETAWNVNATLNAVPATSPALDGLEAIAIAKRLDLAAAHHEEARLARLARLAQRARWLGGSVNLGASLERDRDGSVSVGPSVGFELPLFDQQQATIARLQAEYRRHQHMLSALELSIRSDVRMLSQQLQSLHRQAVHYREVLIPLHEKIVALSQKENNFMLIGLYTLLGVKEEEIAAYSEYLNVTREYWITHAQLTLALGGKFPS